MKFIFQNFFIIFFSKIQFLPFKIPDEKMRTNMRAIRIKETIFDLIIKDDIVYPYEKWNEHLQLHMIKFMAKKYFGVTDLKNKDDLEKIGLKIGKSILQKTLRYFLFVNCFVFSNNCIFLNLLSLLILFFSFIYYKIIDLNLKNKFSKMNVEQKNYSKISHLTVLKIFFN